MRKAALILSIILTLSLVSPYLSRNVYSDELTPSFLRLDRTAKSTASGGAICATTPSIDNGIENSVQIIFPTGFSVNSNPSNWTVTLSNLPTGGNSWPGIGTATSVVGQTVTFPSSNLATSTMYCFNFSSTNALTTPSSTGTYNGTIRTRTAANATIDSIVIGIPIVTSDQIAVTATVPANPTDFSADMAITDPSNGTFPQDTVLTYTLTYGSLLTYTSNITVEASWDLGTIQGAGSPTENILDYVIGSAGNAYGSTPPVVDSVNRKIDWTISAIPGNTTNQSVTFKLRTNSSSIGSLPVSFKVNGRVLGLLTQTADTTVTSSYQYHLPGPSSSSGSSESNNPTATPTETPNSNSQNIINSIDIRTVSSSDAAIFVTTQSPSSIKISYGTSVNALPQSVYSNGLSNQHLLLLTGLSPKTRYYFRVISTTPNGQIITSDLYVLDTAIRSTQAKIIPNSIIVTSGDVLLTNFLDLKGQLPNIILPINTPYSFKLAVDSSQNIKWVKAILRSKSVLGISSFNANTPRDIAFEMTEISPGQYIGRLNSPVKRGGYQLIIQISDYSGNISEQTAANLYISAPFRVIESNTKTGIENAKATIYYYNARLRIFDLIVTKVTSIQNPVFSGPSGILNVVLPEGKYRVEFEDLGYKSKTVEFDLGAKNPNYPQVELEPLPFNPFVLAQQLWGTFTVGIQKATTNLHDITVSHKNFGLMSFVVLIIFVVLCLMSLSRRIGTSIFKLPYFFIYHATNILHKNTHTFEVYGEARTPEGTSIAGLTIYFNLPSGKVLTHTTTDQGGKFVAYIHESNVKIIATKKGFRNFTQSISKDKLTKPLLLQLQPLIKKHRFNFMNVIWYQEHLLGSLFETVLVLTVLIEVLFAITLGILYTLPFIIISILNIFLWVATSHASKD